MLNKKILAMITLSSFLGVACLHFSSSDIFSTKVKAATSENNITSKRLWGMTRFDTSAVIANEVASGGKVKNVILANGYNFPDALSGSVLAGKLNAPIVLSGATPLDSVRAIDFVNQHLDKDGTIYILGGQGAINETIVGSLKALGFKNYKRLGGLDRFETNKLIVDEIGVAEGTPVVIASSDGFADALSISSIAGSKKMPIILSSAKGLSEDARAELKKINPSTVYIIGGTASIDNNTESEIASITGKTPTRIWGQDRYETSLAVNKYFNFGTTTATVASGEGFPDALSGSALATKLNAPILLVDQSSVKKVKEYVDSKKFTNLYIFGGEGVISNSLESILTSSGTQNQNPNPVQNASAMQTQYNKMNSAKNGNLISYIRRIDDSGTIYFYGNRTGAKYNDAKFITTFNPNINKMYMDIASALFTDTKGYDLLVDAYPGNYSGLIGEIFLYTPNDTVGGLNNSISWTLDDNINAGLTKEFANLGIGSMSSSQFDTIKNKIWNSLVPVVGSSYTDTAYSFIVDEYTKTYFTEAYKNSGTNYIKHTQDAGNIRIEAEIFPNNNSVVFSFYFK